MYASIEPSSAVTSAVASMYVYECAADVPAVAMPRPEIHLVARFGPMAPRGLDIHAFGARDKAHRKTIRRGMRTVTARLRLGVQESVLGVPATALAGRIVALDELWGDETVRVLCDRLAGARNMTDAAAILERAIEARLTRGERHPARAELARAAAERLSHTNVNLVADDLGMSERHLRRVFREAVGVSPKTFAKVTRFHRALRIAREERHASWASVAAAAGYYDQAHLIAEFRSIAGATPQALLGELRAAASLG